LFNKIAVKNPYRKRTKMSKKLIEFEVVFSVIDRDSGVILSENSIMDVFAVSKFEAMGKCANSVMKKRGKGGVIIQVHDAFVLPLA